MFTIVSTGEYAKPEDGQEVYEDITTQAINPRVVGVGAACFWETARRPGVTNAEFPSRSSGEIFAARDRLLDGEQRDRSASP